MLLLGRVDRVSKLVRFGGHKMKTATGIGRRARGSSWNIDVDSNGAPCLVFYTTTLMMMDTNQCNSIAFKYRRALARSTTTRKAEAHFAPFAAHFNFNICRAFTHTHTARYLLYHRDRLESSKEEEERGSAIVWSQPQHLH